MENHDINDDIRKSAGTFIAQCDHHYRQQVHDAAEFVAARLSRSRVILLSGPSGSSKTTTALTLARYLAHYNVRCHVVSLDDYYRNHDEPYPQDEDGRPDYESPLGLDLPLLNAQMNALRRGETVMLPHFNFKTQRREPNLARPMQLTENEAVIFEGITALHPLIADRCPGAIRVFVAPTTPLTRKGKVLFDCMKIRLLRRMVRDYNFRHQDPVGTLEMWGSVRRGERLYVTPYASTAEVNIDSTLGYEVPVLGYMAKPMLEQLPPNVPQRGLIDEILQALPAIAPIAPEMVPDASLLRQEFIKD